MKQNTISYKLPALKLTNDILIELNHFMNLVGKKPSSFLDDILQKTATVRRITCVCLAYTFLFRVKNGNPRAETVVCHQEMWPTTMISHEVLISISKCIYLYAIQEFCE